MNNEALSHEQSSSPNQWDTLRDDASQPDWTTLENPKGHLSEQDWQYLAEHGDEIEWSDLDKETQNAISEAVFHPTNKFVESRIEGPKKNLTLMFPEITQAVKKMNAEGNIAEYIADLANIVVKAFKIQNIPDIQIVDDIDGNEQKMGGYNPKLNTFFIKKGEDTWQEIGIPKMVAHELWHAHQSEHKKSDLLYNIGNDLYRDGAEDTYQYKDQLIEREAYGIGKYFQDLVKSVK